MKKIGRLRIINPFTLFERSHSYTRTIDLLFIGGLLILSIAVMFSTTGSRYIGRDSGVYLYIGQRILAGDIPYLDVWDHKGPLIYYLNALGLWAGRGSLSGVIFLQYLFLFIAVWLAYDFLKRAFGRMPALFASLLFLFSLTLLLYPGNWVEEYALPIQFMALYFFWKAETCNRARFYTFLVGATAAIGLLLRPNVIGVQLSIGLYIFLSMLSQREWQRRLIQAVFFAMGTISVLLPVFYYFGQKGALNDFWDAVVRFNLIYSSSSLLSKLRVPFYGFEYFSRSGIVLVALMGWVAAGYYLMSNRVKNGSASLYKVALIALPVEFALISISGRDYIHYFLVWLPILTILCAIFATQFLQIFSNISQSQVTKGSFNFRDLLNIVFKDRFGQMHLASLGLMTILVMMSILPARAVVWGIRAALSEERTSSDLVEYVQDYTVPGSYLLIWGAEAKYNFLTGRPSPVKYVYQSGLFTPGYLKDAMVQELLNDIAKKKPVIIDASARNRKVPALVLEERNNSLDPEIIAMASPVLEYIDDHYEQVTTIGDQKWPVLVYRSE